MTKEARFTVKYLNGKMTRRDKLKRKAMSNFSGKQLKALRKEAGFTQKNLGESIGISRETVSAIENEHAASINTLPIKVAKNWWITCSTRVSKQTKAAFKAHIVEYFN